MFVCVCVFITINILVYPSGLTLELLPLSCFELSASLISPYFCATKSPDA